MRLCDVRFRVSGLKFKSLFSVIPLIFNFQLFSPFTLYPLPLKRTSQPEADVVVAVAGVVVVAVSRAAVIGVEVPAAAAKHAVRSRRRVVGTMRIKYCNSWVTAIPVAAPLQHITVHLVQTPSIGSISLYRHCVP